MLIGRLQLRRWGVLQMCRLQRRLLLGRMLLHRRCVRRILAMLRRRRGVGTGRPMHCVRHGRVLRRCWRRRLRLPHLYPTTTLGALQDMHASALPQCTVQTITRCVTMCNTSLMCAACLDHKLR